MRGRDQRVVKLHEGRIRNLEASRATVQQEVAGSRDLALGSTAVAVVHLVPG